MGDDKEKIIVEFEPVGAVGADEIEEVVEIESVKNVSKELPKVVIAKTEKKSFNDLEIMQVGNGGGFDFNKTNSSFLIKIVDSNDKDNFEFLLIDCGFNVMAALIDLDKNKDEDFKFELLQSVYITHMDDDHTGNLKQLIYYNHFMKNTFTKIYSGIEKLTTHLDGVNDSLIGGVVQHDRKYSLEIFDNRKLIKFNKLNVTLILDLVKGFHGGTESYGCIFRNADSNKCIFISGDTKANKKIEDDLCNILNGRLSCLIYHDFSHWDVPSRNVHACKNDFMNEYTDEFKNEANLYHTGNEIFKLDWVKLEDNDKLYRGYIPKIRV